MSEVSLPETADSRYVNLYRLGGVAAFVVVVLTLGEIVAHTIYPQPSTVSEWFTLFQDSWIAGLLDFWGLEVLMYVMFAIVFLAFYFALRRAGESRMVITLTFALLGVAIFLATNNPFSMLSLSDQYAAATTDAQRSALLAAGRALLANTNQRAVGGFNLGLFLVSVAGLIASTSMLRNNSFTKLTAHIGIAAHALSLVDYLRQAVTQSPIIALLVILPTGLLLATWYALVGRELWQLGRVGSKILPKHA